MIKVVAAVAENEGKYLLCQRAEGGNCAFLWEFPGGKIEKSETPFDAIIRETREELGTEVKPLEIFDEFDFSYPDKDIHFYFIKSEINPEEIKLLEHKDCRWLLPSEAKKLPLCPADAPVIEKLLKTEDEK